MIKREPDGRTFHFVGTFTRKRDAVACEIQWRSKGRRARGYLNDKVWHVFRD